MFYLSAKPQPTKIIFTSIMTPTSSYVPSKHSTPNASVHVIYSSAVYQTRPTHDHTHSLHDHSGHAVYDHLWLIILLAVLAMLAILAVAALLILLVPRICKKSVGNLSEDAGEEMSLQELYQYHAVRHAQPDTAENIQEQRVPEPEPRNRQDDLPERIGRDGPFPQPNDGNAPSPQPNDGDAPFPQPNGRDAPFSQPNGGERISLVNVGEERCEPDSTERRIKEERSLEVVPDNVEGRLSQPDIGSERSPSQNGGVNCLREPNDAREQSHEPDDGEEYVEKRPPVYAYRMRIKGYVCVYKLCYLGPRLGMNPAESATIMQNRCPVLIRTTINK